MSSLHEGTSPYLLPNTQQQHSPHNQQQQQQHCSIQGVLTGNGFDGTSSSHVVCGLLPPVNLPPVDLGPAGGGGTEAPRGASGALGSSESDDTPQPQLSTPTAEAAASIQQQPTGALTDGPQATGLLCQPGVVSMALTPGLPGTSRLGLPAGLPVPGKPPAAASAGLPAPGHQPAAAAATAGDAAANGAVIAGQPVFGVPHLLPASAAGFGSPQVMQQLALPHAAAAAAAAMAAARTAGSILSGPAAMGLQPKPGEDSSNGSFAGFGGSSSSSGQWCTPVCRRSLSCRGPCFHCGTTYSSQWRSGPPHKPVLCNACGLYYRKVQSLPDHTCQVAGALEGPCGHCGVVESPQWRAGPPEASVLCDQCGRHFRKTKTLPKRKRRSLTQHFAGCHHCGSQSSPQWRGGPPEKPTLCNACGLHYRKTRALPERPASGSNPADATAGEGGDNAEPMDQEEPALQQDMQQQQQQQQQQPEAMDICSSAAANTANGMQPATAAAAAPRPYLGDLVRSGSSNFPGLPTGGLQLKPATPFAAAAVQVPHTAATAAAVRAIQERAAAAAAAKAQEAAAAAAAAAAAGTTPPPAAAAAATAGGVLSWPQPSQQPAPPPVASPCLPSPQVTPGPAAPSSSAAAAADVGILTGVEGCPESAAGLLQCFSGAEEDAALMATLDAAAEAAAAAAVAGGATAGAQAEQTAESSGSQMPPPSAPGGIDEGVPVTLGCSTHPGSLMGMPLHQQQQQHTVGSCPGAHPAGTMPNPAAAAAAAAAAHVGWLRPWGPGAVARPHMFAMQHPQQATVAAAAAGGCGQHGETGQVKQEHKSSNSVPAESPAAQPDSQQQQQQDGLQPKPDAGQGQGQAQGQDLQQQPAEQLDSKAQPSQQQQQQQTVGNGGSNLQPYDHLHMAGLQMAPMIHYNWHQALQMLQQQQHMMLAAAQPAMAAGFGGMPLNPAFAAVSPMMMAGGFGPMMPYMDANSYAAYQQQWQQAWQQQMSMQQGMHMQQQQQQPAGAFPWQQPHVHSQQPEQSGASCAVEASAAARAGAIHASEGVAGDAADAVGANAPPPASVATAGGKAAAGSIEPSAAISPWGTGSSAVSNTAGSHTQQHDQQQQPQPAAAAACRAVATGGPGVGGCGHAAAPAAAVAWPQTPGWCGFPPPPPFMGPPMAMPAAVPFGPMNAMQGPMRPMNMTEHAAAATSQEQHKQGLANGAGVAAMMPGAAVPALAAASAPAPAAAVGVVSSSVQD